MLSSALSLLNSQDPHGCTPLLTACKHASLPVLRYLLTLKYLGLSVEQPNFEGATPLTIASQMGHLGIVQLLIDPQKGGVDVERRTLTGGWNALIAAAYAGELEVVVCLVDVGGAEVDARKEDGATPLIVAAGEGNFDVVEYLVGKGADVSARNDDGCTAEEAANEGGHEEVCRWLIDRRGEGCWGGRVRLKCGECDGEGYGMVTCYECGGTGCLGCYRRHYGEKGVGGRVGCIKEGCGRMWDRGELEKVGVMGKEGEDGVFVGM